MKKAVALCLSVLLTVFLLIGCSSSATSAGNHADAKAAASTAATETKAAGSTSAVTNTSTSTRKIEKSAKLTIETLKYDKSTADFESLVAKYNGYIESSNVQGKEINSAESRRTATYTARIPADQLDSFLNGTTPIGNITEKSITGQDVTQNYVDTDAKLRTLKTEQNRLLDMMSKSSDMDTMLKIEQRLTEVQNEIEQLTSELKTMDSLVSFATVTVTITETAVLTPPAKPVEPTFWGQLGSTLSGSFHALVETFKAILVVLTAILPFVIVAAIALAVVLIVRRRGKKKAPEDQSNSEKPKM